MDERLAEFVDHARARGLDHATIRQLLVSAGWRDKDFAEAICARELELPVPVPPRAVPARGPTARRRGSIWPQRARDGFLHVLAFGSMFAWATSLIIVFFIGIDFAFPDPAWRTSHSQIVVTLSILRANLAVLLVTFPVFLFVWHFLLREIRRQPQKALGIRRWLGYLSLFVGGITLAGDTVTLIYLLLEGQLTTRLGLRAAALFFIAGGLVAYLAFTLRSEVEAEDEK